MHIQPCFAALATTEDVRIDVYQHVGTCLLAAEPDSSSVPALGKLLAVVFLPNGNHMVVKCCKYITTTADICIINIDVNYCDH